MTKNNNHCNHVMNVHGWNVNESFEIKLNEMINTPMPPIKIEY